MGKLPVPLFSKRNPYFMRLIVPGVAEDYQPRLTAQDWAYATTWELQRFFLQPKLCLFIERMRTLLWRVHWSIDFRNWWRDRIRALRASKAVPFSKTGEITL